MSQAVSIEFDHNWFNIIKDINSLRSKGSVLEREFIEISSHAILNLIKDMTPVGETSELKNSWRIYEKTNKYFVVGTDLTDKLTQVINGTRAQTIFAKNGKAMHFFIGGEEFFRQKIEVRGSVPNDFIKPIVEKLDIMLELLITSLISKHWKIFKKLNPKRITKINLSKTVGLTGTKRNARRGRGGGIQKAKTGRKSFSRRLSRRRRTGKFITSSKTTVE